MSPLRVLVGGTGPECDPRLVDLANDPRLASPNAALSRRSKPASIRTSLRPAYAELEGRRIEVSDVDGPDRITIASDEPLLRSLDRLGFVSLA